MITLRRSPCRITIYSGLPGVLKKNALKKITVLLRSADVTILIFSPLFVPTGKLKNTFDVNTQNNIFFAFFLLPLINIQ